MDTHIQNNDPASILPNYDDLFSGTKTEGNEIYKYAYPSSFYPILNLGYPIYDNLGNKLDPGHYEVALSFDKKFLLIIQSKQLIAKVPVINYDFDKDKYDENHEHYEALVEKLEKYKVKRNKKKINQYQKELDYLNKKIMAQNIAEIDNSNTDFFILEYRCNFTYAQGYIKRASQD
ncbi:hypothetical protein IJS77_04350 [bacterium]|nr:hypothetical protein [bacterium]